MIPALIRLHLRRAMHSVTDGNKAFSYSQTLLIAFLREEKSKFFSIYINRYGFWSYFCSHLIPPAHTGMISSAVEAATAESTEANTHSGRQSACNCLPPKDRDCTWPPLCWATVLREVTPTTSSANHSDPPKQPPLTVSETSLCLHLPSQINPPPSTAAPLLALISHSKFTSLKTRSLPLVSFLLPAWDPIHLGFH